MFVVIVDNVNGADIKRIVKDTRPLFHIRYDKTLELHFGRREYVDLAVMYLEKLGLKPRIAYNFSFENHFSK